MIDELIKRYGRKCSSINVDGPAEINAPMGNMKFCEAVSHSFDSPVRIFNLNLGCPGARRALGFDKDINTLSKTISVKNNIPENFVFDALKNIPAAGKSIGHVNLGLDKALERKLRPDLFIMYVKPHLITKMMHILAAQKIRPVISDYSFLSICGNVFASTYFNQAVSISFGCPESRKFGGVDDDEVIVGIPYRYVKYFMV